MPKSTRGFPVSDEVREYLDRAEHSVAVNLGRYSKSQLRRMQKSLRDEIFYRALEEMNRAYRKSLTEADSTSK